MAESAGPGEVSGLGVGEGPAAVVAQPVIVAAAGSEVGVDGGSAVGVFDAVVGVGPVGGYAAAGERAGAVADVDPAAQRGSG